MTASNAYHANGTPRKSRNRRLRLATRPAETTSPMTLGDLKAWVLDNYHSMDPEMNQPSQTFVDAMTELHGGVIPDYIAKQINPDTIVSGERSDRVFVRFTYYNDGTVTLYPGEQIPDPHPDRQEPTEADLSEMSLHFSRADYEAAIQRLIDTGPIPNTIFVA